MRQKPACCTNHNHIALRCSDVLKDHGNVRGWGGGADHNIIFCNWMNGRKIHDLGFCLQGQVEWLLIGQYPIISLNLNKTHRSPHSVKELSQLLEESLWTHNILTQNIGASRTYQPYFVLCHHNSAVFLECREHATARQYAIMHTKCFGHLLAFLCWLCSLSLNML